MIKKYQNILNPRKKRQFQKKASFAALLIHGHSQGVFTINVTRMLRSVIQSSPRGRAASWSWIHEAPPTVLAVLKKYSAWQILQWIKQHWIYSKNLNKMSQDLLITLWFTFKFCSQDMYKCKQRKQEKLFELTKTSSKS